MEINKKPLLRREEMERALSGMDNARVGVVGDFCLDLYWHADMRRSELSRETPHFPLPIVRERAQPGGAGNVAANIAALSPGYLCILGVAGEDWRGAVLRQALEEAEVSAEGLIHCPTRRTEAYIKPLRFGLSDTVYEDPRLDFENDEPIGEEMEDRLIDRLERMAKEVRVLCVCDQKKYGIITRRVREKIEALSQRGLRVIVDSRDRVGDYRHVLVKPNDVEAARAVGWADNAREIEDLGEMACRLEEQTGRPAIVTAGAQGCLLAEGGRVQQIASRPVSGPIDICGAGDTFLSALACALAGGTSLEDSLALANVAASVILPKIGVTGTASRSEIRACVPE